MAEFIDVSSSVIISYVRIALIAGTITLVVVGICRWFGWAPINIIVNNNFHKD